MSENSERKNKSRFTVKAGRQIYRDELPFISIGREDEMSPTEADALVYKIATFLNATENDS